MQLTSSLISSVLCCWGCLNGDSWAQNVYMDAFFFCCSLLFSPALHQTQARILALGLRTLPLYVCLPLNVSCFTNYAIRTLPDNCQQHTLFLRVAPVQVCAPWIPVPINFLLIKLWQLTGILNVYKFLLGISVIVAAVQSRLHLMSVAEACRWEQLPFTPDSPPAVHEGPRAGATVTWWWGVIYHSSSCMA